jgi:predicted transcriptional regulator
MLYYKFNPRNHLCSLVWTFFLLITVTQETKLINGVTCSALFGFPTIMAGINLREKAERHKRRRIIKIITERQMLTVAQAANILDVPAQEAQALLRQLYRESRIELGNRSEDMAVVYLPPK